MKKISFFLLALFLTACASTQVFTEKDRFADFSNLRTWNWQRAENPVFGSEILDREFQKHVAYKLNELGYQLDQQSPDFLVSYSTQIDTLDQVTYNRTYPFSPWYYWYHPFYGNTAGGERMELIGKLELKIRDPEGTMIWRSVAADEVSSMEETYEMVEKSVNKIFKQFEKEVK